MIVEKKRELLVTHQKCCIKRSNRVKLRYRYLYISLCMIVEKKKFETRQYLSLKGETMKLSDHSLQFNKD